MQSFTLSEKGTSALGLSGEWLYGWTICRDGSINIDNY